MARSRRSPDRRTFDALYAFLTEKREYKKSNPAAKGFFRYFGGEDLVLQYGTEFTPAPLPEKHGLQSYPSACFRNAYKAATPKGSPWIYVEGYAIRRLDTLGILHAWLTRADTPGSAFDPTWKPVEDDGIVYVGIAFRREYLVKARRRSKKYGLLDAWEDRWPLLTGRDAIEDVILPVAI